MTACKSHAIRATILSLKGGGNVWHRQQPGTEPLSIASLIAAGDRVEMQQGSMAGISLVPGIFLETEDETVCAVEQLAMRKDGNEMEDAVKARAATIRLERGRIRVLMPKTERHRCELRIRTDAGLLLARRNSLFSVLVAEKIVRIVCVNGKIDWNDAISGDRTTIAAGYYLDAGSSARQTVVRAELDQAAEREVEAIYGAADVLEKVVAEMRGAPVHWN